MIIYKNTFENIKTIGHQFPLEDQFYAQNNEAIIADGITRDPIGISDLSKCPFSLLLEKYPRPSGAELAAQTIVKAFSQSAGSLKERLIYCNEQVKQLNDKFIKHCDYLENDYYGAVASCVKIENDILNYAFLCDCGVIIYDKFGNVKFQTKDEKERYSDPYIEKINIPWNLPEARVIVRRDYRNNPNNIINGKCVSYGAITGEKEAINFIRTGTIKIDSDDVIAIYSDGFTPFLQNEEFINHLLNFNKLKFEQYITDLSNTNYNKYGKEKTLVILKK